MNKITIKTEVKAPIDKVWACWTQPQHITGWNFATPEWHCPYAENDLKPGGKFRSTMASRDGAMSFDFEGHYEAVEHLHKISSSLGDGRKVEVEFNEENGITLVKETFDPEGTLSLEMQEAGWKAILENFKTYTENL
jgi:uncharacterized protein YndB with AHSA1/START domain